MLLSMRFLHADLTEAFIFSCLNRMLRRRNRSAKPQKICFLQLCKRLFILKAHELHEFLPFEPNDYPYLTCSL